MLPFQFHFAFMLAAQAGLNLHRGRFLVPSNLPADLKQLSGASFDSSVFLNFGDIEPTEDGVLEFANRYGPLGHLERIRCLEPALEAKTIKGEPFELWESKIKTVRRLTSLWLVSKEEDGELLSRCVKWEKDAGGVAAVYVTFKTADGGSHRGSASEKSEGRDVIASAEVRPEWLKEFSADDLREPANRYLHAKVQEQLDAVSGKPRLTWQRERGFDFRFVSDDLLGAIWVSFAEAIAGNKTFRRCEECKTWFEIAPDVARTHRRYCSETCRGKAYRGRQDKARQLHSQKKSFKEIAEELDSDVSTVKRWVTGFKK